jgi:hypothetical protein
VLSGRITDRRLGIISRHSLLLLHPEYYYKQSLEGVSADNDTVKHCNLAYSNIDKFNCGCGCAAQAVCDVELDARLLRLSLTFVQ